MQGHLECSGTVAKSDVDAALNWAAQHQSPIVLSVRSDDTWTALKSAFVRFDPAQRVIQILHPQGCDQAAVEIVPGQQVGVSFRRSHKKCIFSTVVALRRTERPENGGGAIDTIILRTPVQMHELQRRAYQRVICPADRFIAVRLWEGPGAGKPGCWPLCSGRVSNVSVGGVQVDVRQDQNPRLSIGDRVGVEITVSPGSPALMLDAQYRHCAISTPGRMGLGFQFLGLEHDQPERATIGQLANFVKDLQRSVRRQGRGEHVANHSEDSAFDA